MGRLIARDTIDIPNPKEETAKRQSGWDTLVFQDMFGTSRQ